LDTDLKTETGIEFTVSNLRLSLSNNMKLLAECFEKLSPERELEFPGKAPKLASTILRNLA
jgi:hypothetical protein